MNLTKYLLAGLILAHTSANATPVNLDFSAGTSGWTVNGSVSTTLNSATVTAGCGGRFTPAPCTLAQTFAVDAGDTLFGFSQWLGADELPANDNGFVKITEASTDTFLFYADILSYGNYGSSLLTPFLWTSLSNQTVTLTIGAQNVFDNTVPSSIRVSDLGYTPGNQNNPTTQVPEPGPLVLLLAGLFGYQATRRQGYRVQA